MANQFTLYSPVKRLKGVGPQLEKRLAQLNLLTVQDCLYHLPFRYEDRTCVTPIKDLEAGQIYQIQGKITKTQHQSIGKKVLTVELTDDSGSLTLKFFNIHTQQLNQFRHGDYLLCYGLVQIWDNALQMSHPDTTRQTNNQFTLDNTLTPVYPLTKGLHQSAFRKLIKQILTYAHNNSHSIELLPTECQTQFSLNSTLSNLEALHFPSPTENIGKLRQQIAIEELIANYLYLIDLKTKHIQCNAPRIAVRSEIIQQFINSFPFELTNAQTSAINDIVNDLSKIPDAHRENDNASSTTPMLRLIQGDVGSGKTVTAAIASLCVALDDMQTAIMAPTEILANQHYATFKQWFSSFDIEITLLTSQTITSNKQAIYEGIRTGTAKIIIGTQALYQEQVEFKALALTIIDEQHRFGVEQRRALQTKRIENHHSAAHQLILSATPIPRSLAMTLFSCLDISVIDEKPKQRQPVKTAAIASQQQSEIIKKIEGICSLGQQAYWVCPAISSNEDSDLASAQHTYQQLQTELPNRAIGLIHGKLSSEDKTETMLKFNRNDIDILVATTVIEVGLDNPNATVIVIENADHFGLAQLHQLRGRVGRGSLPSYCILLYNAPLSHEAHARLDTLRKHNDGFKIAEEDLNLRGPGEIGGTAQTGAIKFKTVDLQLDHHLLPTASQIAKWLHSSTPNAQYRLFQRWIQTDNNLSCLI